MYCTRENHFNEYYKAPQSPKKLKNEISNENLTCAIKAGQWENFIPQFIALGVREWLTRETLGHTHHP